MKPHDFEADLAMLDGLIKQTGDAIDGANITQAEDTKHKVEGVAESGYREYMPNREHEEEKQLVRRCLNLFYALNVYEAIAFVNELFAKAGFGRAPSGISMKSNIARNDSTQKQFIKFEYGKQKLCTITFRNTNECLAGVFDGLQNKHGYYKQQHPDDSAAVFKEVLTRLLKSYNAPGSGSVTGGFECPKSDTVAASLALSVLTTLTNIKASSSTKAGDTFREGFLSAPYTKEDFALNGTSYANEKAVAEVFNKALELWKADSKEPNKLVTCAYIGGFFCFTGTKWYAAEPENIDYMYWSIYAI